MQYAMEGIIHIWYTYDFYTAILANFIKFMIIHRGSERIESIIILFLKRMRWEAFYGLQLSKFL